METSEFHMEKGGGEARGKGSYEGAENSYTQLSVRRFFLLFLYGAARKLYRRVVFEALGVLE